MPRDRGPFRTGERVLVPHTDKYYEAKVNMFWIAGSGLFNCAYSAHYAGTLTTLCTRRS